MHTIYIMWRYIYVWCLKLQMEVGVVLKSLSRGVILFAV